MKTPVVAVLDIGKTNKKVSLYDGTFQTLASERKPFGVTMRDGLEVEQTDEMLAWFRGVLAQFSREYEIRAISISSQGATCALLDEKGDLAYPVISYTSEKGAEIADAFYAQYGDRASLHQMTGTPDLGFANAAKMLFYVRTRMPEVWARTKRALFLPQYLGYLLTGQHGMEPTYLGNHNYLWNIKARSWSTVGQDLNADRLFPPMSAPWDCLGTVTPAIAQECGLPTDCKVTLGIHDSNANFLPYLAQGYPNCILNSTGTWCVAMQLAASPDLTDDEIAHKIFFNVDVLNRPVKTSVFPGGLEYETFTGFTSLQDTNDEATLSQVVRDRDLFIITGVLPDATIFAGSVARVVHQDKTYLLKDLRNASDKPMTALGASYLAALNLSLAIQSAEVFKRFGASAGTTVFIEGGFARNPQYCELLAALCPDLSIVLTSLPEGTSMGAALLGWMLLSGKDMAEIGKEFTIETRTVTAKSHEGLDEYVAAFHKQVNG